MIAALTQRTNLSRWQPTLRVASELFLLFGVLLLAAYLRLANVTDNPGWFSDEGSNLDVAYNLQHGRIQYMALGQSTLMVSRLPLFESLLAASLKLFGGGITTLRTLTGSLGVISVLMLYLCVRLMTHRALLALLSALFLAIYPQAVLYSRFGFSYNLLSLFVPVIWLGLWEYTRSGSRRWLFLVALFIGLGTISDVWMLSMFAPFGIVVLNRCWRDVLWSVLLAALPFSLYLLYMFSHAPQATLLDMQFVLFRVSNVGLLGQVQNVALNYAVLLSQDFWMPCAVIGFIVLTPTSLRNVTLLMFFLLLAVLGRTIALYSLSAHYMIPLLPFVAFGTAILLYTGLPYLWRHTRITVQSLPANLSIIISIIICLLIVGAPFLVSLSLDLDHARNGFPTSVDPFLINPTEARQVAQFINTHTQPDELVIVTPAISWLINAHTADIQMSIAATGQGTAHYPPNIPSDRWVYDPRINKAHYVVLDNFWRTWGVANIVGLESLIKEIQGWPQVFQAGSLIIYQNPTLR